MSSSNSSNGTSHAVATPPQGSGPGVVLLYTEGRDAAAMDHAALALGEEGYVATAACVSDGAGAAPAVESVTQHLCHRGRTGLVAFGAASGAALDLLEQGAADCAVLYDPPEPQIALAAAPAADAPVTLHLGGRNLTVAEAALRAARQENAARPHPLWYMYEEAAPGFALAADAAFDGPAAGLAWSRTVAALKRAMGPHYNLEELWAYHLACEFRLKDAAETMSTMVPEPYVNHVPTLTGGVGYERLRHFYAHHFVTQVPADRRSIPISQTVGTDRIVDEKVFCFTHDAPIDWLLPGVAPTGRYVEIPLVGIVTFRGDKLVNEHIYWDQASVLVQVGLLDPAGLPVAGRAQTAKLLDKSLPSNELMPNWEGP